MAKNKETSTTGNEYKFTAGSRNALIRDLQRVQVLFPNPNPDLDYYRAHGEFTDEAWKQEFPRFEDFLAEARVTTVIEVIWHLRQAAWLLRQQEFISYWDERDVEAAFGNAYGSLPPLDEESQRFADSGRFSDSKRFFELYEESLRAKRNERAS
jgi:hypothetical protein